MNYKKSVTRAVILFNKTLGEKIGEQIGGEQITVVIGKAFKESYFGSVIK